MNDIRWYVKLNGDKVLQVNINGMWKEPDEAVEYDERKHEYGKYHPTDPNQERYEWE